MFMETEKSRPGKANDESSSLSSKAGEDQRPTSKTGVEKGFFLSLLFYSGFQWIGRGPPTLERASFFTQSTD